VSIFLIAVGLSLVGGVGGLLVASGVLLISDSTRAKLIPWLVSYAVGALLGVSMLDLLPSSLAQLPAQRVFATLLMGILLFFVLEKLVLWRHCHIHDCEVHESSVFPVLVGDAFHNFVDGAVVAAAVMTSVPLGISTALAVAAHEIPQEVGDFAILLNAGYSRRKALLLNLLSSAASAVGAIAALVAFDTIPRMLPYFLAMAAASFLYVAMADLIPGLHRGRTDASSMRQILLIAAGYRDNAHPLSVRDRGHADPSTYLRSGIGLAAPHRIGKIIAPHYMQRGRSPNNTQKRMEGEPMTRIFATVVVMLAMGAPAWAAQRENLEIFRDVSEQVLQYSRFTIFDSVGATVHEGVVTLSGKVTMPFKSNDIERRVASVEGVTAVRNDVTVLPVSQFDDELRLRIARAIYGNANFWGYGAMRNPPVHIIVEDGHVTLEGVVNSNIDRLLARSMASTFGTFSVTNNLKTDAEIVAELERL
jgi:zinc and cadmium transporter